MAKVRGEREQVVRQGPGVTSGLGGRGDLRGKNAVADLKQTNKQMCILVSFHISDIKDLRTFGDIIADYSHGSSRLKTRFPIKIP